MSALYQLSATHPKGVFHGVPAETYFASPGVSNSMLKGYADDPLDFLYALNSPPAPASEAQMVGTVAHRMILEGKLGIPPGFAVKPEGMSFATKDGKAWREAHQDLPIISQAESDSLQRTAGALLKHPVASKLFGEGRSEGVRHDLLAVDGRHEPREGEGSGLERAVLVQAHRYVARGVGQAPRL